MTRKPRMPVTTETSDTLVLETPPDGDFKRQVAAAALRPSVQGAASIRQWKPFSHDVDLSKLIGELQEQAKLASSGQLARSEAMLITQAHTLDAIFNNLAPRARAAEYLPQFEAYLRLGLKAQSQCRSTLETLVAIRSPGTVAFVRQANIANGPQQVNNAPIESPGTPESEKLQTKVLEVERGEWLDAPASEAAVRTHSNLETVGMLNGTENRKG
jgi:hypothetical protein